MSVGSACSVRGLHKLSSTGLRLTRSILCGQGPEELHDIFRLNAILLI